MFTTFVAVQAHAADIEIDVHNFTVEHGIARVVFYAKNRLGEEVTDVFIDCAFLDKDKRAIGIGRALVESIPAKGDAFDDAALATNQPVQFADCRVAKFTR